MTMRWFTKTAAIAVMLAGSGCAALSARIDIYNRAECPLPSNPSDAAQIVEAAKAEHVSMEYTTTALGKTIEAERNGIFAKTRQAASLTLEQLRKTNDEAPEYRLTSVTPGGAEIAHIVHAKRNCWSPPTPANKARAVSRGGNADIAIKMEKDGKFTVKGVRLDAEAVTEAVFKSVSKAIELVAQTYGVDVEMGSAEGGNGSGATTSQAQLREVESNLRSERRAAAELLDVLAAEAPVVGGADATARAAAAKRIKAAFDARRSLLSDAPAPTPTPTDPPDGG